MSSWPTFPVRRLFSVVNGGTPTADDANWGGEVPWATPVDLAQVNGGMLSATERTLTEDGLKTGSRAVSPGSLVLSTRAPIGYVAETSTRTAFNQGCRGLVPVAPVILRYFRYQFSSLTERLSAWGQGSTFIELSGDSLAGFPLVVPPASTQAAIVAYLDRETARIDALIAVKRRMVGLLEERLQGAVSEATHARSVADPSHRLPDDWQLLPLKRCLGSAVYGIGEASQAEGEYAVLGMTNISSGEIVGSPGGFVSAVDDGLLLAPDDLLFNRTNSRELVGKVGLVRSLDQPTTFASYLVRLRTNKLADAQYLNYLLNAREVLGIARSMALPSIGQANLNPNRYSAIVLPIPPIDEQHRCVSHLNTLASRIAEMRRTLERQAVLLQERRQALITAAVTGQLDIQEAA